MNAHASSNLYFIGNFIVRTTNYGARSARSANASAFRAANGRNDGIKSAIAYNERTNIVLSVCVYADF